MMTVDENFLLRILGRFGPISSVKIMWPRTDEERRRQQNCGFVAFMNRADRQEAKDEMQGVIVYEYELKIGRTISVVILLCQFQLTKFPVNFRRFILATSGSQ